MDLHVSGSQLRGRAAMPASKSHTIRAAAIAALAEGRSTLVRPLASADTEAALRAVSALGARVEPRAEAVDILGVGGRPQAGGAIDVANSGTTLRVMSAVAALAAGTTHLTGDEQIQSRPIGPLLEAITQLGAEAVCDRGNGCAPVTITGPMRGGSCEIECRTSQYLTALLIGCPLAPDDTHIDVTLLNERPYVSLTLDWLDRQGIEYRHTDLMQFDIPGGQSYRPFERVVPADFSSATFFLCAAAVTGSEITLLGLDFDDPQGDKAVVEYLRRMGAQIDIDGLELTIRGGPLTGGHFDLNSTPDALPAMAVTACFAQGETVLANVPQARIKETDRIAVMALELGKMGARVDQLEDGLVVTGSPLTGARVGGHGDHRVVMALAVAGLAAQGETTIDTAEAMAVTFPDFVELMRSLGAEMRTSGA
ncbi:MAG TPA: 3-phosphoshikimate 1-carboxyvinyltransferase [Armatimonadetes bacterium]|jgi:3-phosphoshikimate 1-carboxyvinyltransferase|nr:3-phosphoshikimate 1-carboxyvinyltransferase [Armatimonadota bacterium]